MISLTMEERIERLTTVGTNPTHVVYPLINWYSSFYDVSKEETIQILIAMFKNCEKNDF